MAHLIWVRKFNLSYLPAINASYVLNHRCYLNRMFPAFHGVTQTEGALWDGRSRLKTPHCLFSHPNARRVHPVRSAVPLQDLNS